MGGAGGQGAFLAAPAAPAGADDDENGCESAESEETGVCGNAASCCLDAKSAKDSRGGDIQSFSRLYEFCCVLPDDHCQIYVRYRVFQSKRSTSLPCCKTFVATRFNAVIFAAVAR